MASVFQQIEDLIMQRDELKEALQFYVSICGNTAHNVSKATAQAMYGRATAALAIPDPEGGS